MTVKNEKCRMFIAIYQKDIIFVDVTPKFPIVKGLRLDRWVWKFKLIMQVNHYKTSITVQKKWSFPLRISSVNVTKSAVSWGFDHIYWRNPSWKTALLCAVYRNIHQNVAGCQSGIYLGLPTGRVKSSVAGK